MRNRIMLVAGSVMLMLGVMAGGQNMPARGPSTPGERTRLVAIAHKLEAAPLDKSLTADREWALRWLIEVPDISVKLCAESVGKDFLRTKYKYRPELTVQLTLSSAAFVIEHPDQAGDSGAVFIAGAEGMLKSYAAILRDEPEAKWKALDEAIDQQQQGHLAEFVRANSQNCK